MDSSGDPTPRPEPEADTTECAECGTRLVEGQDRQQTDEAVFCRPCFDRLTHELGRAVAAQGENVNYPMALLGGVGGAAVGVAIWWGFTIVTKIAFGLVAVVIGFAVGKGVAILSGHKRHLNLQIMSVVISVAGFAYASYLVNRTFLTQAFAEQGEEIALPLLPNAELFYNVVAAGFSPMDLVFLAIVAWQAWTIPAPVKLASQS